MDCLHSYSWQHSFTQCIYSCSLDGSTVLAPAWLTYTQIDTQLLTGYTISSAN